MKKNTANILKPQFLAKYIKFATPKKKISNIDLEPYFSAMVYKEFAGEDFYC